MHAVSVFFYASYWCLSPTFPGVHLAMVRRRGLTASASVRKMSVVYHQSASQDAGDPSVRNQIVIRVQVCKIITYVTSIDLGSFSTDKGHFSLDVPTLSNNVE